MTEPESLPATEYADPRYEDLDAWPPAAALHALWEAQLAAAAAVGPAVPAIAAAVSAAVPRMQAGGRLIYVGAGTSARIAAQDGAELGPTFDWPDARLVLLIAGGPAALMQASEGAEDNRAAGLAACAAQQVGANDVMLALAASGRTPFTCACVEAARDTGALTVGIANAPGGALLALAAHPVLIATGAEPLAGSTRLKAGTAQKIVLNLFSTALMLQLGRVHRGRMVDMHAANAKLRDRGLRMLRDLTGADALAAAAAFERSQGHVKLAVLLLRGLDPTAAEGLLQRHAGHLRSALVELDGS
jgi:N-acetylmuramic acid 6-phosphate etherase